MIARDIGSQTPLPLEADHEFVFVRESRQF